MFRRFLGSGRPGGQGSERTPWNVEMPPPPGEGDDLETETVRRIVARLEALPIDEARYIASFAYVMSRAAEADLDISDAETALIERFVSEYGGIDASQAVLVAEMAKLQARLQGGTEDFVVTREFREMSTMEQRVALLRCCFAVEAADGTITADEASVVNEIARELDVDAETLNEVRAAFHDQLSSVQALRRATGGTA